MTVEYLKTTIVPPPAIKTVIVTGTPPTDCVRVSSQTFSTPQKLQARANIGLGESDSPKFGSIVVGANAIGFPVREKYFTAKVSDATNDVLVLGNGTGLDGSASAMFAGYLSSINNRPATLVQGMIPAANDVVDGLPVVVFRAVRTNSDSDPINGAWTGIQSRTLFAWGTANPADTNGEDYKMTLSPGGVLNVTGGVTVNGAAVQTQLVSGTSIKTINGTSLLGSGDLSIVTDISGKVDKVAGKGLSTEDYTTVEKNKLAAITGTNTGDETTATIRSKLGISVLSGANTGDQDLSSYALKSYVDNAVTGLFDLRGTLDCSANPNYPVGLKGDAYPVTVAGRIGGASGILVDVNDLIVCSADNAGGTHAAVGSSWFVLERNLVGALVASNNLADLANAATARANLGLGNVENAAASALYVGLSGNQTIAGNKTFSGTLSQQSASQSTAFLVGKDTSSGYTVLSLNGSLTSGSQVGLTGTGADGQLYVTGPSGVRLRFGNTERLRVDSTGTFIVGPTACEAITSSGNIFCGANQSFQWTGRGGFYAPANGQIQFVNGAGTSFDRIYLGQGTSSFPMIKRNGAGIDIRLGDDTAGGNLSAAAIIVSGIIRVTETTSTPTGTTQTITLANGNHQTLDLASSTGSMAVVLTVPASSAAGTIIVRQHGTTPRAITWTVSSGSIVWMGTQPTWSSDAVSSRRVVAWRWDGSVMHLAATDPGT